MIMQKDVLNNVNIQDEQVLITPESLKEISAESQQPACHCDIAPSDC